MDIYQVGGDHYGLTEFQHWDWVALNRLDYFAARISAYVSRHRSKNGIQDLEKARHFALKAAKLAADGILSRQLAPDLRTDEFISQCKAGRDESFIIRRCRDWWEPADMQHIAVLIERLITTERDKPDATKPDASHASEVLSWKRFTFEGSKEGSDWYRCRACRDMFTVPNDAAPVGAHNCKEA